VARKGTRTAERILGFFCSIRQRYEYIRCFFWKDVDRSRQTSVGQADGSVGSSVKKEKIRRRHVEFSYLF